MFGNRVTRKSRKYLVSHSLRPVIGSCILKRAWGFMISCIWLQAHEIILFLNPYFRNLIRAMNGRKIHEELFGYSLMPKHDAGLRNC